MVLGVINTIYITLKHTQIYRTIKLSGFSTTLLSGNRSRSILCTASTMVSHLAWYNTRMNNRKFQQRTKPAEFKGS
jgi:hypothetical protein